MIFRQPTAQRRRSTTSAHAHQTHNPSSWGWVIPLLTVAVAVAVAMHLAEIAAFASHHRAQLAAGGVASVAAIVGLSLWVNRGGRRKLARNWPRIAESIGMDKTKIVGRVRRNAYGQSARLRIQPGKTVADLIAKTEEIDVGVRRRPGAARIIPDPANAAFCTLLVLKKDPLAKAVRWPGSKMQSVTEPMVLGVDENGRPATLGLWVNGSQRMVLVGGVNGSGKSNFVNVCLGNLTQCSDLAIWAIDLKGGVELEPWRDSGIELATNPVDALALLKDAVAELDRRYAQLAGHARRWTPGKDGPLLLIVVDELSQLNGEALSLVLRIACTGRAAGVQLLLATQHPSAKQLESQDDSGTALRGQMHARVCMRVTEAPEVDMILGRDRRKSGFVADRMLTEPGTYLIDCPPEHLQPRPQRTFEMIDDDVAAAVKLSKLARVPRNGPKERALASVAAGVGRPNPYPAPPFETTDDYAPPPLRRPEWARPRVPGEYREDPPEAGTHAFREYMAALYSESWRLFHLRKIRPRPPVCEGCDKPAGKGPAYLRMHHFDYTDPWSIAWYCEKCHVEADRERRAVEGQTGPRAFTTDRVSEMMEHRRRGASWKEVGDQAGLTWKQARGLCERRFPDDPIWNRHKKAEV